MYVRSLIADIARSVNSCATTIELKRVQQGDFKIEESLNETEWNIENIRQAIEENERNNPSVIKLASNNT
jgi:tRNA U55 pseudouridine synthase TruB